MHVFVAYDYNVFFSHVDGHRLWTGRHVRHTPAALASIRLFGLPRFNLFSFPIVVSPHIFPLILVFSFCAPPPRYRRRRRHRFDGVRDERHVRFFTRTPRPPRPPTQRHPSARDPPTFPPMTPRTLPFCPAAPSVHNESLRFAFLFIYNHLNRYYSPHDGYVNNLFLRAVQTHRWKRVFKHALEAGFIVRIKMYDPKCYKGQTV